MRLARERHAKRVVDLKIRRMIKQLSARDPRIFVCSHSLEQNSRCRRSSATVSPVTALRAATQSAARSTHLERTKLRNFMLFLALK